MEKGQRAEKKLRTAAIVLVVVGALALLLAAAVLIMGFGLLNKVSLLRQGALALPLPL